MQAKKLPRRGIMFSAVDAEEVNHGRSVAVMGLLSRLFNNDRLNSELLNREEVILSEIIVDPERRSTVRFPIRAKVTLSLLNGLRVPGRFVDMSVNGALFEAEGSVYNLEPGEEGELFLSYPPQNEYDNYKFFFAVVRVDQYEAALCFSRPIT